jgi:tetratricopeptide (TPR) repeat protein
MGERERDFANLLFAAESAEEAYRLLHEAHDLSELIAELDVMASGYQASDLAAHAELARYFSRTARALKDLGYLDRLRHTQREAAEPDQRLDTAMTIFTEAEHTKSGLLAKFLYMKNRGIDADALLHSEWAPPAVIIDMAFEAGIALLMLSSEDDNKVTARVAWIAECLRRGLAHQAARHRRRLETILARSSDAETLRTALAQLGDRLWPMGLAEPAVAAYQDALDVPVELMEAGNLSRATQGLELALKLRGLGRTSDAINVLTQTDLVLTDLGMLAELSRTWGLAARMTILRGLLLEDLGDYDQGRLAYEDAQRLAERSEDDRIVFEALTYEAASHLKARRLRAAIQENRRIVDWTFERPHFRPAALNNLAHALAKYGSNEEAARCYRQVTEIYSAAGNQSFGTALAWFGLGDLASESGDPAAAEDAYLHALDITQVAESRRDGLVMLLDRLCRLPDRGNLKHRLLEEAEAADDWMLNRFGCQARARWLSERGELRQAQSLLRDLLRRATDRNPQAVEVGQIRILLAESLAAGTVDDRQAAFDLLWSARDVTGCDLLIDLLCHDEPPGTLPDDRSAHELAFDLLEEAKCQDLLPQLAAAPLPVPAAVPAGLVRRESDLLEERRAATRPVANLGWARLRRLDESLADVWSQIEPYAPEYVRLRRAQPATLRELRRELARDTETTLVSFRVGKDNTVAFTYTPRTNSLSVTRVPVSSADLAEAARRLERTFNGAPDDFPPLPPLPSRRPGKRSLAFFDNLGPRLLAFLAEVPAGDHLLVSPDESLHALPLHALPADGEPLITRHAVTYMSAASTLRYARARRGSGPRPETPFCAGVAALEDLDRDAIERDAALFTSIGLAVDEVHGLTATSIEVLEGLRSRNLAHITCHGHYDARRPLDSGLLLSDGDSRPSRVPSRMPLYRRLRHLLTVGDMARAGIDVGLITLRACSTNRYDPAEQVTSLANALLFAGADSVIAALWNVDQTSSARLLRAFYQRLAENPGQPLWRSFWATQREMLIEAPGTPWESHPYHWAAFVLIGDWR